MSSKLLRFYFLSVCFAVDAGIIYCQDNAEPDYNILFIVIDDLRAELGYDDNDHIQSPIIDALADKSVVFNNAYAQYAHCSPSRSSFLTGLRPDSIKVYDLDTHIRQTFPEVVTLPQLLKENGYTSVGMGKVFHNNKNDEQSWDEFYDEFFGLYANAENNELLRTTGKGPAYESANVDDNKYKDGQMTNLAITKLKELQHEKFFLAVGFVKPHLPFSAPTRYWDLYKGVSLPQTTLNSIPNGSPDYALIDTKELRSYHDIPKDTNEPIPADVAHTLQKGYYACISYMDAQVGRLLEELEKLSLHENTIVILTSDHGFKLGEYGLWGKHSNVEFDTRVPLMIYHPQMDANERNDIVELIDLYPTISNFANLPITGQGQHLFDSNRKNIAISQMSRDFIPVMGYSIRKDDFRYAFWVQNGIVIQQEYFDHKIDPFETENRIEQLAIEDRVSLLKEFNVQNPSKPIDLDNFILGVENHGVRVYPNPAKGKMIVDFHHAVDLSQLEIVLFDTSGTFHKAHQVTHPHMEIELKNHGLLLYQITKNGVIIKKGKISSQ